MVTIVPADLTDARVIAFLEEHLRDMEPTAPEESRHALDLAGLRAPGVRVWTAVDEDTVVGTVALAALESSHEELKSMRADPARRGQGIGRALLQHALDDARSRGVTTVSLETGSDDFFVAARSMYLRAGFRECGPFGSYRDDPNSVYLTREL